MFAVALAAIPAMIANFKGRSIVGWYLYGFAVFPIALCHAIRLPYPEKEGR
ncbi:hypothetical protein [Andreprevotia chitinilytica]|uniref:hypothetical protein n=1 Tax=Andreprevotia chitinilytica TaxID=396808 RepID=UPI0012EBCD90|nr:hypothetical protein [Andreprevotia chitinilytica]